MRGAWISTLGIGTLVCLVVLAQLVGLFALGELVSRADVRLNHGQGASCHDVDLRSKVPLAGIETRRFDESWSWWPPGLVCRTELAGRTVSVHEPTWRTMGSPMLAALACVVVSALTAVIVVCHVDADRWRRHRVGIAGLTLAAQPLVLATALAAIALPAAL